MSKPISARRRRIRRRRRLLVLLLALVIVAGGVLVGVKLFSSPKVATTKEEEETEEVVEIEPAEAKLCVAGDIMIHAPFLRSSYYLNNGTYNFSNCFKYIQEDYQAADYTVCTFEGVLGDSNFSGYPTFVTPKVIMNNLQNAGIDLCLLANNHIYDGLTTGFHNTMNYNDSIGLDYIGIRQNVTDKPYRIQDINGIKVGMIDYVYQSNDDPSITQVNAISVTDEDAQLLNSFNYYNLPAFYSEVTERYQAMLDEGAEVCIIYMHWGTEYKLVENTWQDQIAQQLCDIGFNCIIGSHPHVIEPVDILTSSDGSHQSFVAYAIGNHLSNQRTEFMDGLTNGESEDGMMLNITFDRDTDGNVSITDIEFLYTWVYMYTDGTNNNYYILPLDDINNLAAVTGITDLGNDPQLSINRTNAILGDGPSKVKAALPIQVPNKNATEDTETTEETK